MKVTTVWGNEEGISVNVAFAFPITLDITIIEKGISGVNGNIWICGGGIIPNNCICDGGWRNIIAINSSTICAGWVSRNGIVCNRWWWEGKTSNPATFLRTVPADIVPFDNRRCVAVKRNPASVISWIRCDRIIHNNSRRIITTDTATIGFGYIPCNDIISYRWCRRSTVYPSSIVSIATRNGEVSQNCCWTYNTVKCYHTPALVSINNRWFSILSYNSYILAIVVDVFDISARCNQYCISIPSSINPVLDSSKGIFCTAVAGLIRTGGGNMQHRTVIPRLNHRLICAVNISTCKVKMTIFSQMKIIKLVIAFIVINAGVYLSPGLPIIIGKGNTIVTANSIKGPSNWQEFYGPADVIIKVQRLPGIAPILTAVITVIQTRISRLDIKIIVSINRHGCNLHTAQTAIHLLPCEAHICRPIDAIDRTQVYIPLTVKMNMFHGIVRGVIRKRNGSPVLSLIFWAMNEPNAWIS